MKSLRYYFIKIFQGKKKAKEFLLIQKREILRLKDLEVQKLTEDIKKLSSQIVCEPFRYPVLGLSVVKLHLGCGSVYKEGWINIDKRTDGVKLDLNFDLCKSLPFEDGSVDFIFNEHFLEHLSVEQGVFFLKECFRVLKKGGVLRIAMPHIKPVLDRYYNDKWREEEWLEKFGYTFIKTKCEVVNVGFRYWGHQWLYDEEELKRRLNEAGFTNCYPCKNSFSNYPELANQEAQIESELIFEAVRE